MNCGVQFGVVSPWVKLRTMGAPVVFSQLATPWLNYFARSEPVPHFNVCLKWLSVWRLLTITRCSVTITTSRLFVSRLHKLPSENCSQFHLEVLERLDVLLVAMIGGRRLPRRTDAAIRGLFGDTTSYWFERHIQHTRTLTYEWATSLVWCLRPL